MSHNITVEGGKTVRLPTKGKYCDRDIVVTAAGGAVDLTGCVPSKTLALWDLKSYAITSNDATSIGDGAFVNSTALTSVDLPVATSIGESAFQNCTALTSVDLPVATSIGKQAFNSCTALTRADLPSATIIGASAFSSCTALTSVDLPAVTSIDEWAFDNCTALTSVDLSAVTSIGDSVFYGCTNLKTLIIRNEDAVCELNVSAIVGTGILTGEGAPTGEGFIYVPTKFYENYVSMMVTQVAYMLMQMMGMGEAEAQATADYMVRAVLRKIEDYPEICG